LLGNCYGRGTPAQIRQYRPLLKLERVGQFEVKY